MNKIEKYAHLFEEKKDLYTWEEVHKVFLENLRLKITIIELKDEIDILREDPGFPLKVVTFE